MDSVEAKFQAIGHAELLEDGIQMVLHRLVANEQLLPDFLIPNSYIPERPN